MPKQQQQQQLLLLLILVVATIQPTTGSQFYDSGGEAGGGGGGGGGRRIDVAQIGVCRCGIYLLSPVHSITNWKTWTPQEFVFSTGHHYVVDCRVVEEAERRCREKCELEVSEGGGEGGVFGGLGEKNGVWERETEMM